MARWCRTCGREKELHPVEEKIVADTESGTKKVRIRVCRTKLKQSKTARGHKRTVSVPDHKAYDKARKRAHKDRARRQKVAA